MILNSDRFFGNSKISGDKLKFNFFEIPGFDWSISARKMSNSRDASLAKSESLFLLAMISWHHFSKNTCIH